MKSFRSVEHPSRVGEDTGFLKRRSQTTALARDWAKKRHAEEANSHHRQSSSASLSHFSQSCTLQSIRRSHGTERKEPSSPRERQLHHGHVPLGKIVVPWPVEQKTRERNKEPDLSQANASWAPWAHGCLEGRRREGAILVQQRCQWSAASAGVTSVFRLHDATNAYLSMKHDVAKQAANEMARKEIDKFYFDQRISLAVVTVGGEEGNIDVLARSGIWPGDFSVLRASS